MDWAVLHREDYVVLVGERLPRYRDAPFRAVLIALLAFLVIAVLAMVVFGVITVGEVKEFDVFRPPRFNRLG